MEDSKIKIYVGVDGDISVNSEFCLNSDVSLIQWWVRRYCSFSIASFEDQICLDVRGHWFGCSFQPVPWDAVTLLLDIGFICRFVVIDPTDRGATTVVAPERMVDNFPYAESLPLYRVI
jgi:hypothetical protein